MNSPPTPFLFNGKYSGPVPPLAYVVVIGSNAWPLAHLREVGTLEYDDIEIKWHPGMASTLDEARLENGRDIGYVTVTRLTGGRRVPVIHDVTFAFAFKAFVPEGSIHAPGAPR